MLKMGEAEGQGQLTFGSLVQRELATRRVD